MRRFKWYRKLRGGWWFDIGEGWVRIPNNPFSPNWGSPNYPHEDYT